MSNSICNNIEEIERKIGSVCEKAGRDPSEILLIAVSKTKPVSDIEKALACGHTHFGENRARELQQKMEGLDKSEIQWHFVGPMQSNKIKYMVERVNWIHSVYKKKYFREIEKRASEAGRVIDTLVQINISGEDQKQGCPAEQLAGLLEYAHPLKHLRVRGLMGMATFTENREVIRNEFRLLKRTFDEHQHLNGGSVQLEHLSMGMTNDLEIAIEEGSTMLRIGTAIFGERDYG